MAQAPDGTPRDSDPGGIAVVEPLIRSVIGPYRLGALLLAICERRLSGRLLLSSDVVERTVYFHSGFPVFSQSTQFAERLGPVGIRLGLLSRERLAKALALSRSQEWELGRALLKVGYVNGSQLFALLGEQLVQQLAAACGGIDSRARFFEDDGAHPGLAIMRLHPMTAVMAAVRNLPEAEYTKMVAGVRARRVAGTQMSAVVQAWLTEVGYMGDTTQLLQGEVTVEGLTARIGEGLRPGTDHGFQDNRDLNKEAELRRKRPGSTAVPFGTRNQRQISSMQMQAVTSPPINPKAAELVTLSLLLAGPVRIEGSDDKLASYFNATSLRDTAEGMQRSFEKRPSARPPEVPDGHAANIATARDKAIRNYLRAERHPDVATRMAVWGPGIEATDEETTEQLLTRYLTVLPETDPRAILGLGARTTDPQIDQAYNRLCQFLTVAEKDSNTPLTRCKVAELRALYDWAFAQLIGAIPQEDTPRPLPVAGRRSVPPPGRQSTPPARASTPPTPPEVPKEDPDARVRAELDEAVAQMRKEIERLIFAGDWRGITQRLGPTERAVAMPAELRLSYGLALGELSRDDQEAKEITKRAISDLMDAGQGGAINALVRLGSAQQRPGTMGFGPYAVIFLAGLAVGWAIHWLVG